VAASRADCGRVEDRPGRAVLTFRGVRPERLLVVWSLHCGLTREAAAQIAEVARSTGERDVHLYREGGLEALRTSGREYPPTSELAQYTELIRQSLEREPVRIMAEACHRIEEFTGVKRGPTQVRTFLKGIGLKRQRICAIPVPPPKKSLDEHNAIQAKFLEEELNPVLEAAQSGWGHVFFVDAAHFVLAKHTIAFRLLNKRKNRVII
jgi:transposase